jgi:hypothetical protein
MHSPPHYIRTERREVTFRPVMDVSESTEATPVDEEMLVVNITTESFSISSTLVISERLDENLKFFVHHFRSE